jgi:hypothetical protein
VSTSPRTSTLAQDDLRFAAQRYATKLKVFVGGPEIKREWTWRDWKKRRASALLRLRVHKLVESLGHESVLGEHRQVTEMAQNALQVAPSVVVSEAFLVSQSCNCIILIPDSPGSFCELGAWSISEKLGPKMLLLVDQQYEPHTSYINPHVLSIAADNNATIVWIDYNNWRLSKPPVEAFLKRFQEKAFRKGVLYD